MKSVSRAFQNTSRDLALATQKQSVHVKLWRVLVMHVMKVPPQFDGCHLRVKAKVSLGETAVDNAPSYDSGLA